MGIKTIKIPPGMVRLGTPYENKGRWTDGSLVRWYNGVLRSVGGWLRHRKFDGTLLTAISSDVANTVYRDGFSWSSNSGSLYRVFGANDEVKLWLPDNTYLDITPVGFVGSSNVPNVQSGFGRWLYGRSTYGTPRPIDPATTLGVWRWSFDTWGEDLILGPSSNVFPGSIYTWDTSVGSGVATIIANAPTDVNKMLVTDQRIIMTIGSSSEPRLVRWCDRENYTDWTPTELNYAGDKFLQGKGPLLDCVNVLDQVLILSASNAHVARWVGAPLAYGFDEIGSGCGPWNGSVCYATETFAMWPGRRVFWKYDGTLKPVPCPIMDYLIDDMDTGSIAKAFVTGIPQYNEIWWHYQSKTGTEVDSYAVYNYVENLWYFGRLDRTASISGDVFVNPTMVEASTQYIYEHELQNVVADGSYAQTGPLELGEGEQELAVSQIFPDTSETDQVLFSLIGQDMPTSPQYTYGPYPFSNPIEPRAMGRNLAMRVDGNMIADWRVGNKPRFNVIETGTPRRGS